MRRKPPFMDCPFCGSDYIETCDISVSLPPGPCKPYSVYCSHCGASTDDLATEEEAADAWNRRPIPDGNRVWLTTGGRNYKGSDTVARMIHKYPKLGDTVIHGAATGADSLVEDIASALGIKTIAMPAWWDRYKGAGGPIRNRLMIHVAQMTGLPIAGLIAFPGGPGTAGMTKLCKDAGIPIIDASLPKSDNEVKV